MGYGPLKRTTARSVPDPMSLHASYARTDAFFLWLKFRSRSSVFYVVRVTKSVSVH